MEIGPQCAWKGGQHRALIELLRKGRKSWSCDVIEEPDPLEALGKIGMSPDEVAKVDPRKLVLSMAELGAGVNQMTALRRLSRKGAVPARMGASARDALECFSSASLRWRAEVNNPESTTELKAKAGVVCAALQGVAFASQGFVTLNDNEVRTHEAEFFRTALTQTLVDSRLYPHMVLAKREILRRDANQYMLSFEEGSRGTVSGRAELDFAAPTQEVIEAASEGSRRAKEIFTGLERTFGELTVLTAVHWLDDMNIRGKQVPIFLSLVSGSKADPKDPGTLELFFESLDKAGNFVEKINALAAKKHIPHQAVISGGQMGNRPVMESQKTAEATVSDRDTLNVRSASKSASVPEVTGGFAMGTVTGA